jgi:hypothetical protein
MIPQWRMLHPRMTEEHLGLLPAMLDTLDPASAREQLHRGYSHGGGWRPFKGCKLNDDNSLSYPGDPDTMPMAQAQLGDELIVFYQHAWVAVIQPDRSYEVCRMD